MVKVETKKFKTIKGKKTKEPETFEIKGGVRDSDNDKRTGRKGRNNKRQDTETT